MTKIEKDDQEAATDQVLLVQDQEVKVQIRSKRSPKAGEQNMLPDEPEYIVQV